MPADTRIVYAAQGETFEAVVADMERPPNLDAAKHWLACYVMLSRAKSLDGFLVLRPALRKELSARPPKYMLDELRRLEELEGATTQDLLRYIRDLDVRVPEVIQSQVLAKDAAEQERARVRAR